MFVRLNPPGEIAEKSRREVEQVREVMERRRVNVGTRKRQKFDRHVKAMYEAWESNTSKQRTKLQQLNAFFEGAEEPNDHPFGPESSQIDLRLAAATARTLRAHFIRAVFSTLPCSLRRRLRVRPRARPRAR